MLLGWFSPSGGGRGQSRDPLLHQDGCGLWVFNLCCDAEGGERWSILQQSNFPVHLEHRTRQAEQEAEAGSAQLLVPHTIRNVTPLLMHIQGDQESVQTGQQCSDRGGSCVEAPFIVLALRAQLFNHIQNSNLPKRRQGQRHASTSCARSFAMTWPLLVVFFTTNSLQACLCGNVCRVGVGRCVRVYVCV